MADVILPPSRLNGKPNTVRVFLAGAIDMGKAAPWQNQVIADFEDTNAVTFFNPRREDWDASWTQTLDNPQFVEQVNWELDYIERAHIVFMYFPGTSVAPISLLEFGLCIGLDKILIVAAEPEYHRRGNLAVMCDRAGITLHSTLESATLELEDVLADFGVQG